MTLKKHYASSWRTDTSSNTFVSILCPEETERSPSNGIPTSLPTRSPSRLEHSADIAAVGGFFREPKRPLFAHLPRSAQQGAEGGASKTAAQADAPDADCREIRHVQRSPRDPHENIHRQIHRANQCGDFVFAGDPGRVENICA